MIESFKQEVTAQEQHEHLLSWQADDFDTVEAVKDITAPMVEIGGPVLDEKAAYSILSAGTQGILEQKKKRYGSYISNINTDWHHGVRGVRPKLDLQADGGQMPFANESLGVVFASCLDMPAREGTIKEAYRMLQTNGLLVWNGTFAEDMRDAVDAGFSVVAYKWGEQYLQFLPFRTDATDWSDVVDIQRVVLENVINTVHSDNTDVAELVDTLKNAPHLCAPRQVIFRKR